MSNDKFVEALVNLGWIFEESEKNGSNNRNKLLGIAKGINENYYDWCFTFIALYSPDEKSWFVSADDFNGNTDLAFSWDEFEKISLDSCDNKEEEKNVFDFWRSHLPVLMSTNNGYGYIALKLTGLDSGSFYYGFEPEFELPRKICDDFEQLKIIILSAVERHGNLFLKFL